MSETSSLKDSQHNPTEFVLISFQEESSNLKAIGVYKTEEDAYAKALLSQMQVIEASSEKWTKTMLSEKQDHVIELCRYMKEDLTAYKDRFEYMTRQCDILFQDLCHIHHRVLPVIQCNTSSNIPMTESIFKTKVRNFLDVFRSRLEVEEEEDLDNSDDEEEDEDEEEEEAEEEDIEEDIEDEDEEEEEEELDDEEEELEEELLEEEEETRTSEIAAPESSDIEDDEEAEQQSNNKKRKSDILEEDEVEDEDEEDEIDEDNDEDELEDEEDPVNKKRRVES